MLVFSQSQLACGYSISNFYENWHFLLSQLFVRTFSKMTCELIQRLAVTVAHCHFCHRFMTLNWWSESRSQAAFTCRGPAAPHSRRSEYLCNISVLPTSLLLLFSQRNIFFILFLNRHIPCTRMSKFQYVMSEYCKKRKSLIIKTSWRRANKHWCSLICNL